MEEQNELGEIKNSLNGIAEAVKVLSNKIDKQEERLNKLEGRQSVQKEEAYSAFFDPNMQKTAPATFSAPPPPPPAPVATAPAREKVNMEENIGGKWFARIGITALVLGVSFFLKYAFDNGWIEPLGRVTIGIIGGLVLLGIGEKTIRKYSVYGQMLTGGGIAILYLSIFAAFDFYQLMSQIPAFICMTIITAIGIALSLRYDAISLIMVAVLGGFCTPFLISSGENNQPGLFSYILILDLAILAVSIFKKWRWLNLVGFVGTFFVFTSWAGEFYSEKQLFSTMFFLTLFFVVYSISSLIYNLVKKEKSSGVEQALTLLAGTVYFAGSFALLDHKYHDFMGFFAVIVSIYYFLWAYLTRIVTPEDENLYNFLAFFTVGFITLAIPLQFDQNVITIGWVIEAVLLMMLGIKVKRESIIAFSAVVFTFVVIRLLFIDTMAHLDFYSFLMNKTFFTFCVAIAGAYVIAYLARGYEDSAERKFVSRKVLLAIFIVAANFLTIFSISREIMVYYENEVRKISAVQEQQRMQAQKYGKGQNISYADTSYEVRRKLESRSSVTLSLFWLVYGIILMAVGVVGKYKGVRLGGLALLMLAILKLFFFDLWSLGTLYRIISSISLGIVLLAISFVYQKYKDKIKEII